MPRRRHGIDTARASARVMRAAVVVAACTSMSNFSPGLVPSGLAVLQQFVTLGAWAAFIAASYGVRPATRMVFGTEALALALFYGFACCSVLWANQSPSSLMKGVALAVTSFASWRVAAVLSVDALVDCTVGAFVAVCLASLAAVVLVPGIGIDHTWMHDGYWQGIFESKQALGGVTAVLIVMSVHRWSTGRSTAGRFVAVLALAGVMNVMSGSRDALGLAVLGCVGLYGAARSPLLLRALCFAPAAMVAAAAALLGFLWTTGEPFIPVFGVKVDLTERVIIWAYALSHFGDRPIAGFGLDGFWTDPDVLSAFNRQHGWVLDNYHDGFLAVVMETGMIGMTLFFASTLLFGLKAAWLARHGRMDPAHHRLMVVFAAMLFFANFTETYFLRSTNYMAVLGFIVLALACRGRDGTGEPGRIAAQVKRVPALRGTVVATLSVALAGAAVPAAAAGAASGAAQVEPAFATAYAMGRGINLLGYDGIWDGHADNPFRLSDFRTIRAAGFSHVRINLFAFRHMDAGGRLDDTFLGALDTVIGSAVVAGLVPVIDEHDNAACQADPDGCAAKLKRFWTQIAARYAGRLPSLVFEVLNEPGWRMTEAQWNRLSADCLAIVRASNPNRTVVVAVLNALDAHEIDRLALPEADRNIIVTVHYYKPLDFTHQGAPWNPKFAGLRGVAWGSAADRAAVEADFDVYAAWAASRHRPIYLGEFGVYDAAPMAQRAAYDGAVAKAATARGWPWAYWQFDHDFALFDTAEHRWIRPILDAIVPPDAAAR